DAHSKRAQRRIPTHYRRLEVFEILAHVGDLVVPGHSGSSSTISIMSRSVLASGTGPATSSRQLGRQRPGAPLPVVDETNRVVAPLQPSPTISNCCTAAGDNQVKNTRAGESR